MKLHSMLNVDIDNNSELSVVSRLRYSRPKGQYYVVESPVRCVARFYYDAKEDP